MEVDRLASLAGKMNWIGLPTLVSISLICAACVAQEPAPDGRYAVGRADLSSVTSNGSTIKSVVWYPAHPTDGTPAEYWPGVGLALQNPVMERQLRDALGSAVDRLNSGLVKTYARANAPIAKGRAYPLLLFCGGLGLPPFLYSAQLEDLASHGYIVAAIEEPIESGDRPVDLDHGALRHLANGWAEDMRRLLTHLLTLSRTKGAPFYRQIDAAQVGVFGHSLGGRAAAAACLLDGRIRACLNEDGTADDGVHHRPYWPIGDHAISGSFAMLDWFDPGLSEQDLAAMHTTLHGYAGARLEPAGEALKSYVTVVGGSYRITIVTPGMSHLAFTDAKWLGAADASAASQAASQITVIRKLTLLFFDSVLGNNQAGLCGGSHEDFIVQCFRK